MIVYTTNVCMACNFTKLHLQNLGISYTERNVAEHEEFLVEAQATGFTSMPIVVVDGRVIASGFQPDRLDELEGSN